MRKRVLGGLLLAAAIGAWWWTRVTPPVTEAEARAYLARIVAAAQARDFERVCKLNGSTGNCRHILDEFNLRGAVPSSPPTVISTRYHRKGRGGTAGRVLVVEGTNACGKRYRTDVFVFRENRFHFKAINAVYWSNARLIEDNEVTVEGSPPPKC